MKNDCNVKIIDDKEVLKETRLSGIRKIIANRMQESLRNSPQATITGKADMSNLISLRKKYLNQGIELSFTDLFIKIAGIAIKLHPEMNVSLQDGKIIQYKSINIGVAVGTDKALFVPVIKNVQDKNLIEVSEEFKMLVNKIHGQKITSEELTGGTFTISNMGMFKVDVMTPILNSPEAAILSIGRTCKELVVEKDDTIKIKPMTTLSLTLDHAVLDGLPAARFLETFMSIMENPLDYFN